jgi:hypothetical protein
MSQPEDCDGLDRVVEPSRRPVDEPTDPPAGPRLPAPRRAGRPELGRDILRDLRPDGFAVHDLFVRCPECGDIAAITWRSSPRGAFGAVAHAKVHCLRGHWFLLPAAWLTPA